MAELPFTTEEFLNVFREYNLAVWPAQFIFYLLGIGLLLYIYRKNEDATHSANIILAFFWIWIGLVYHMFFFSAINPAAYLFGILFIIQGIAFLLLNRPDIELQYVIRRDFYGIVGGIVLLYAMVIYPVLGYLFGHIYPSAPVFGLAPCPTTIFTLGLLLWTKNKIPYWVLVIPGLWSLIGFSAAYTLSIYEDIGLVVAGIISISLLIYRRYRKNSKKSLRD